MEISDDIVCVFTADRQTDKTRIDACCKLCFFGKLSVSRAGRMKYAGMDVADG